MNYEKVYKSSIENLMSKFNQEANDLHLQIALKNKEAIFEKLILIEGIFEIINEIIPGITSITNHSSLTRHLHFVRYYYDNLDYERMLGNSEDVVKRDLPIFLLSLRNVLNENKIGTIDEVIFEIESKLRRLIHKTPSSEIEVQDMVENLFVGRDFRYERETVTIPYSTKHYRPDFILNDYDVAIDVKFCKSSQGERKIIDELNADIIGYKKEYPHVLFIIYDLGAIQHTQQFKNDIEEQGNVYVIIIKH